MNGLNLNNKAWISESLNSSPFAIHPSYLPFQSHLPVHPQVNLLSNHHQIFSFLPLAHTIPSSLSNCYPSSKISLKTTTFQNSFYLSVRIVLSVCLWPGRFYFFLHCSCWTPGRHGCILLNWGSGSLVPALYTTGAHQWCVWIDGL